MWSEETVAKRIDKEYVAVLIDMGKDEEVPVLYDVSAMPTLVIAEADGAELSKAVGAPFSAPEGAIKWFDEIGGKISAYAELNAKWNESKHTDIATGDKLAESALELGKPAHAVEIYEVLITAAGDDKPRAASLHLKLARHFLDQFDLEVAGDHVAKADKLTPAEGEARIDVDVVRAKLFLFDDKLGESRALADKYYDKLLEKSDARAIDFADILMGTDLSEDTAAVNKKGRAMYAKLAKVFEKHERVWELKVYAAWYGLSGDEREVCKNELAEIAEKGEGQWKDIAKSVLEGAEAEEKEKEEEGGNG